MTVAELIAKLDELSDVEKGYTIDAYSCSDGIGVVPPKRGIVAVPPYTTTCYKKWVTNPDLTQTGVGPFEYTYPGIVLFDPYN